MRSLTWWQPMRSVMAGFAALIVTCLPALADPIVYNGPLSKAQAVARVRMQGFDVQGAQADLDAARARSAITRSALLPQLSLAAIATNAHLPQLGMPVARQTYLSGTASVPLFNPALSSAEHAAGIAALAAVDDLAGARNDAVYAAYQAYDQAVLDGAVADARKVSVADQAGNVALMGLMVRSGKAANYQLVRAQASLAQSRQAAEDAAAQHDEAVNDLKVLLDFDSSSRIQLSDGLTVVSFSDKLGDVIARAREQRPELRAARKRFDAAAASLRQAKAAFQPAALLSAQTYNGASSPSLGSTGSQVSAQLSIPLVDGGARSAMIAQAITELEKAKIEYDRRSLMVQAQVANAWRELTAAQVNLLSAQAALTQAQENLRVARLRQRAGKAIELEILDALSVSATAREAALRAQARADLAVAGVHHAAGDLP